MRFAHTAPVHVEAAGKPLRPRREQVEYLIQRVEKEIEWNEGVLPDGALAEYREALDTYRQRAAMAE